MFFLEFHLANRIYIFIMQKKIIITRRNIWEIWYFFDFLIFHIFWEKKKIVFTKIILRNYFRLTNFLLLNIQKEIIEQHFSSSFSSASRLDLLRWLLEWDACKASKCNAIYESNRNHSFFCLLSPHVAERYLIFKISTE